MLLNEKSLVAPTRRGPVLPPAKPRKAKRRAAKTARKRNRSKR